MVAVLLRLGADLHRKDARGLSAAFWSRTLDGCPLAFELNAEEVDAVARVEAAKRRDVRDSLVLDLASGGWELATDDEPHSGAYDFKSRMSDGIATVARGCTLPTSTACTVVSFLEKLGAVARLWPAGRVAMAKLAFRGRLAAIAKTARGDCALAPQQVLAAHAFTSSPVVFSGANAALRGSSDAEFWRPFVSTLNTALSTLPAFTGTTHAHMYTHAYTYHWVPKVWTH